MDDLVQWLWAALDEDERIARRAGDSFRQIGETGVIVATEGDRAEECASANWTGVAEHIVRHDPARVLREIEAKRRLVGASNGDCSAGCRTDHTFSGSCGLRSMGPPWDEDGQRWVRDVGGAQVVAPPVTPDYVLRLLALPYADQPGYREEWRP